MYIFHNLVVIFRHLTSNDKRAFVVRTSYNAAFKNIPCSNVKIVNSNRYMLTFALLYASSLKNSNIQRENVIYMAKNNKENVKTQNKTAVKNVK